MEPFKNYINAEVVRTLSGLIKNAYPNFAHKRFERICIKELEKLELKDRAIHIGDTLWNELPEDPARSIEIIEQAIQTIPILKEGEPFDRWMFMAINAVLTRHGLEAIDASIKLLPEVTKRFTAELGIRVFLIHKPQKMRPVLKRWVKDPNPHVRRLVSEGTRPRLPWAEQITAYIKDPSPVLPLLETLKDDPSEYVRRSVANNLNDISKDNPELMLDVIEDWLHGADSKRTRLIKHACRGLIKQGDARCLKLLGYRKPKVKIETFSATPNRIVLGEKLILSLDLVSTATGSQDLIVDYKFHLVKADGQTAPKVFKGNILSLPGKHPKNLKKSFHLKPISTRKYYSGTNTIEALINGETLATTRFHLTA